MDYRHTSAPHWSPVERVGDDDMDLGLGLATIGSQSSFDVSTGSQEQDPQYSEVLGVLEDGLLIDEEAARTLSPSAIDDLAYRRAASPTIWSVGSTDDSSCQSTESSSSSSSMSSLGPPAVRREGNADFSPVASPLGLGSVVSGDSVKPTTSSPSFPVVSHMSADVQLTRRSPVERVTKPCPPYVSTTEATSSSDEEPDEGASLDDDDDGIPMIMLDSPSNSPLMVDRSVKPSFTPYVGTTGCSSWSDEELEEDEGEVDEDDGDGIPVILPDSPITTPIFVDSNRVQASFTPYVGTEASECSSRTGGELEESTSSNEDEQDDDVIILPESPPRSAFLAEGDSAPALQGNIDEETQPKRGNAFRKCVTWRSPIQLQSVLEEASYASDDVSKADTASVADTVYSSSAATAMSAVDRDELTLSSKEGEESKSEPEPATTEKQQRDDASNGEFTVYSASAASMPLQERPVVPFYNADGTQAVDEPVSTQPATQQSGTSPVRRSMPSRFASVFSSFSSISVTYSERMFMKPREIVIWRPPPPENKRRRREPFFRREAVLLSLLVLLIFVLIGLVLGFVFRPKGNNRDGSSDSVLGSGYTFPPTTEPSPTPSPAGTNRNEDFSVPLSVGLYFGQAVGEVDALSHAVSSYLTNAFSTTEDFLHLELYQTSSAVQPRVSPEVSFIALFIEVFFGPADGRSGVAASTTSQICGLLGDVDSIQEMLENDPLLAGLNYLGSGGNDCGSFRPPFSTDPLASDDSAEDPANLNQSETGVMSVWLQGLDPLAAAPTQAPTFVPMMGPTNVGDIQPDAYPVASPIASWTRSPAEASTSNPSEMQPAGSPSLGSSLTPKPIVVPSLTPTHRPSNRPSYLDDLVMGPDPNVDETVKQAVDEQPTMEPTTPPTTTPTRFPTSMPVPPPTPSPTRMPVPPPTPFPVNIVVSQPTPNPTTENPTSYPSSQPTIKFTFNPTARPSLPQTPSPTTEPSLSPTLSPTVEPTLSPTLSPTVEPSLSPTTSPTTEPTLHPTTATPTMEPTMSPSEAPTPSPTEATAASPTSSPTGSAEPTVVSLREVPEPSTFVGELDFRQGPSHEIVSPSTHAPTLSSILSNPTTTTTTPTDSPTGKPTSSPSTTSSTQEPNPTSPPTGTPTSSPTTTSTGPPTSSPTTSSSIDGAPPSSFDPLA